MACNSQSSGSTSARRVGNLPRLPNYLLLEVFLQCDCETLLIIEQTDFGKFLTNGFWFRKCRHDSIAVPSAAWNRLPKPLYPDDEKSSNDDEYEVPVKKARQDQPGESNMYQFDYKKLYFKNPWNRNLAHPMEADTTRNELERNYNVRAENCKIVPQSASDMVQDPRVKSYLALDFYYGYRDFVIDLNEIGLDADFIDHIRPKITARELCFGRNDSGTIYRMAVYLSMTEEELPTDFPTSRTSSITKQLAQLGGGQMWETVEHVFEDYPAGVRELVVCSTGSGGTQAGGQYGPKFTNTEIIIEMPVKPKWRRKDDVVDDVYDY